MSEVWKQHLMNGIIDRCKKDEEFKQEMIREGVLIERRASS